MSKMTYSVQLLKYFASFAHENRAYWILPAVVLLSGAAALVVVAKVVAPLIYTIF